MSRSRKKSPYMGVTLVESDRVSKAAANRALRLALKQAIAMDPETPPPVIGQVMNRWNMAKEGKYRFDPRSFPKGMRK